MKIQYCRAMLKRPKDASTLAPREIPLDGIPDNILDIIRRHEAFSRSASFGRAGLGSPEEYEKLIITEDDETRTFEYFNKAISYMTMGTEKDRPIFQVFAYLAKLSRE